MMIHSVRKKIDALKNGSGIINRNGSIAVYTSDGMDFSLRHAAGLGDYRFFGIISYRTTPNNVAIRVHKNPTRAQIDTLMLIPKDKNIEWEFYFSESEGGGSYGRFILELTKASMHSRP